MNKYIITDVLSVNVHYRDNYIDGLGSKYWACSSGSIKDSKNIGRGRAAQNNNKRIMEDMVNAEIEISLNPKLCTFVLSSRKNVLLIHLIIENVCPFEFDYE